MENLVIGIDLGTTNSCICYYYGNKVRTIENPDGDKITPSFIFFTRLEGEQESVLGKHGKKLSDMKPRLGIYGIKRLVGRNFDDRYIKKKLHNLLYQVEADEMHNPVIVLKQGKTEKRFTPQELYTIILLKFKQDIEKRIGEKVNNAVITVPAHFNVTQREVTLAAAKAAGFNVLKLLNEPTAAALSYYHEFGFNKENYSLVFDLGGGTFDVAILRKTQNNVRIVAVGGDSMLGGQDFDDLVFNYLCNELEEKYNYNPKKSTDYSDVRRIRNICEEAKKSLSTLDEVPLDLRKIIPGHDNIVIDLSRATFEQLINKLLQKTINIMDICLRSSGITKDKIDEVILAGGSTRIPKIERMVSEYFDGKKLNNLVNPDECVAEGAALQAAMLSTNPHQQLENIKLVDVVPLSLGIADFVDKMEFLIKRNSPIPVTESTTYTTSETNQTAMYFRIFEGERLHALKNRPLGNLTISNITPAPQGQCEVTVTMSIDKNGILTIKAEEEYNYNVKELRVDCIKGIMSDVEIHNKLQDAEKYKNEDQLFLKFAERKSYLLLYCEAIIYNLDVHGLADRYRDVYEICFNTKSAANVTSFPNIYAIQSFINEVELHCKQLLMLYKSFDRMPLRNFKD